MRSLAPALAASLAAPAQQTPPAAGIRTVHLKTFGGEIVALLKAPTAENSAEPVPSPGRMALSSRMNGAVPPAGR